MMKFVFLSSLLLLSLSVECTRKIGKHRYVERQNKDGVYVNRRPISFTGLTSESDDPKYFYNVAYSNVGQVGTNSYSCLGKYDIPLIFHVIHGRDGTANVTSSVINEQVKVLNKAYKETIFQFHLASVNRIENDKWVKSCMTSKNEYQKQHAKDTQRFVNVYTCPTGDTDYRSGYATSPWEHSEDNHLTSVIVDSNTLPGGSDPVMNLGINLVHELGTFFGLFNIHEHGCFSPGDYVSDTPYQEETWGCPDIGTDTCEDQPGQDIIDNFMGAFDDACMSSFTTGQVARMNENFLYYKPRLAHYSSRRPCNMDGIFRWSDGRVYMFAGDSFYRYNEVTRNIDNGYPAPISTSWKGVPSDIDDVCIDGKKRTFFIKGGMAYLMQGRQVAAGYPKKISSVWSGIPDSVHSCFRFSDGFLYFAGSNSLYKVDSETMKVVGSPVQISKKFSGVPSNISTAITWYNGDVFFFKEQVYYRWSPKKGSVVDIKPSSKWWRDEKHHFKTYTTLWHCNGLTYFFNGSKYWRFDDEKFQVSQGYPMNTSLVWKGVPSNIDSAFVWECDGKLYFFKCDTFYEFNSTSFEVVGKERKISSFWKGVPDDIDGVFQYSNGLVYFFKDSSYYRFNSTTRSVDAGYPKPISSFWKGVPDDITSVLRWSNGYTYFFKDDLYYRFNDTTTTVDHGYPKSVLNWKGVLFDM